jgi:glycosyltransferase involved in cell wall biosynthesis
MELQSVVFIYGSRNDIGNILQQATIGILTSKSEGLPVALLEYGFYKLPVVVTAVGEIPTVVKNNQNGLVVSEVSVDTFASALKRLITDASLRDRLGQNLQNTVTEEYTEKALMDKYLMFIQ